MNRRGLGYLVFGLLSAGAILAGGHIAKAQQSDANNVRATIDGFHEALSTLDIGKVNEFWASGGPVE
jgi:hypothetical protein